MQDKVSKTAWSAASGGRLLGATAAAMILMGPGAAARAEASTPSETQKLKDQQELAKGQLDIEAKALANAQAAQELTDAKNKALVDAFPKGDTTGKTEVKDNAGAMEADGLAAVAVNALAGRIAREVHSAALAVKPGKISDPPTCDLSSLKTPSAPIAGVTAPVLLVGSTDTVGFGQWERFRFRACSVGSELDRTFKAVSELKAPAPKPSGSKGGTSELAGSPAAIGAAITAASKLAQLITPDHEVGGIKLTPVDRALMMAVASAYLQRDGADGGGIYWAGSVSRLGGSDDVFRALQALETKDQRADTLIASRAPGLKTIRAAVDAAKAGKAKAEAKARLDAWTSAIGALQAAQAAYADLIKDLNGKEGEAALPINQVVQQAGYAKLLGPSGLALSVHFQGAAGGYYTRRVIWNLLDLNGPPYYVSGGVTVNYAAVRAADQKVRAAGLFTCNAGYVKINKVAARVNAADASTVLGCAPIDVTTGDGSAGR